MSASRRTQACNFCRSKKIRCSGKHPCDNCRDFDEQCVFTPNRRARRKAKDVDIIAEKIAHLESLLEGARATSSTHELDEKGKAISKAANDAVHGQSPDERPDVLNKQRLDGPTAGTLTSDSYSKKALPNDRLTDKHHTEQTAAVDERLRLQLNISDRVKSVGKPTIVDRGGAQDEEITSIYSAISSNLEYQGPKTAMSILSKPGVDWVSGRTGSLDFQAVASRLTHEITRRLTMEDCFSVRRHVEPSFQDALRYTKIYFEDTSSIGFKIVHRSWFEVRLKHHYERGQGDDEPSWYALRNTIFAFGCRIEASQALTFIQAAKISWPYFQNALSVHTELLYWRTSVISVQALTLMAYYTEAISSPTLEYMLCSSAMRLACAKGLHRQPASSWEMLPDEEMFRNSTFWALYCLDKQITSRSGRPSSIDDDEISCHVPGGTSFDISCHVAFFETCIKLNQLSAKVSKTLSSARAFRQTAEEVVKTVFELDTQLTYLKNDILQSAGLELPLNLEQIPSKLTLTQALVLQFTYYCLVLDMHTVLTYPWSCGISKLKHHAECRRQIEKSTAVVAETSRAIVLDNRYISVDVNCPLLIGIHVPLYSLINLFIHVLRRPYDKSCQPDIMLMEVAAGHFARLDFVAEYQAFAPFARDISRLARDSVNRAKTTQIVPQEVCTNVLDDSEHTLGLSSHGTLPNPAGSNAESSIVADDDWINTMFNDDIEMWSTLLPGIGSSDYTQTSFS